MVHRFNNNPNIVILKWDLVDDIFLFYTRVIKLEASFDSSDATFKMVPPCKKHIQSGILTVNNTRNKTIIIDVV